MATESAYSDAASAGAEDGGLRVRVCTLGRVPYEPVWRAMQSFTDNRKPGDEDQLWFLEHDPVYTQGQAGKAEHILNPAGIPVVQVDRGGQVTYHGPGQLVVYLLIDLRRRHLGVRQLVDIMERSLVTLLARYDVNAYAKPEAPGVYVGEAKIASLGLRVRKGCSFHGLGLNIDTDLAPFRGINPCGYAGMAMTRLIDELPTPPPADAQGLRTEVADQLLAILCQQLGYTDILPGKKPF